MSTLMISGKRGKSRGDCEFQRKVAESQGRGEFDFLSSLRLCVPASLRPCVFASLRPCVPALNAFLHQASQIAVRTRVVGLPA